MRYTPVKKFRLKDGIEISPPMLIGWPTMERSRTTLVSLALMIVSIVFPSPLLLVMAMSLGQLFGTMSLALYLLAIVLDLQGFGEHEELGTKEET